jgi:hypothetical protein
MRAAAWAAVAGVLLILAAGCGGSDGKDVARADLRKLVLTRNDVGPPFSPFYIGRQTRLDNQGTARADPKRDGRLGGWVARFHRGGTPTTRGPLVVESRADAFGSSAGARADLDALRSLFEATAGGHERRLRITDLGAAAVADTYVQPGAVPVRFVRIAWRDRNVTASVVANGFEGGLSPSAVVVLARLQERRIARN